MLPDVFGNGVLVIQLFPEHHDVALWCKMATEDAEAGDDNCRTFNCLLVLSKETGVNWDEDDPNDYTQRHAGAN